MSAAWKASSTINKVSAMYYRIKTSIFIAFMPLLLTGCPPIQTVTPSASETSIATDTPFPTPTTTPTVSPTSTPSPIENAPTPALALFILQSDDDVHLIAGRDIQQITEGTDLVVYSKVATGAEVPIALLRVFAKTAENLEAQTIMLRREAEIRPNLRVDLNVNSLGGNEMEFAPSIPADGYLIADHFIYLRSGTALSVGAELQTLKLVQPSAKIIGAVPASSPLLRVIALSTQGNIAEVELIKGTWPTIQTLVVVVAPAATTTQILVPTPAQGNCVSSLPIPTTFPGISAVSVSEVKSSVCGDLLQFVSHFTANYLHTLELTVNHQDAQYIEQIARGAELRQWKDVVIKAKIAADAGNAAEIAMDINSCYIQDVRIKSDALVEVDFGFRGSSNDGGGLQKTPGLNVDGTYTMELIDGKWYVTSSKRQE